MSTGGERRDIRTEAIVSLAALTVNNMLQLLLVQNDRC